MSASDDPRSLYLELLKRTLTGALAEDADLVLGVAHERPQNVPQRLGKLAGTLAGRFGFEIARKYPYDETVRATGRDTPSRADSMIGLRRMDNVQECIEAVIRDGVPGDLIETGVWRGGTTILMRGVLKAYGDTTRTVWVADSFQGLPASDTDKYPADAEHDFTGLLRVGVEVVKHNFERYQLLDEQVRFLVGWFKDTLPTAPIEQLAVARLDGDMYESTIQAIEVLYPKLSPGGFCIVDDYGSHASQCGRAIHDYRDAHGITEEIVDIDGYGAYWRKGGA